MKFINWNETFAAVLKQASNFEVINYLQISEIQYYRRYNTTALGYNTSDVATINSGLRKLGAGNFVRGISCRTAPSEQLGD